MKHLFKSAAIVAASLLLAVNFSSCNKDPQPTTVWLRYCFTMASFWALLTSSVVG